ncbi:hypothetical protein COCVIDRAFT_30438 [Bipolaris victoriae FI3]|uniref:Ecp2 effector protein domain-containing protein n=1 Tax=Bipolaris victoriae (strain FI3) TaxID=930091 RepID=W7E9F4_BIPV3|nr:hypothetical protein COCVIDRAFT_30438 [Bipolaris victoriae FI3]
MRFQSLLAFPVSLALLWSAAGPFTNAAPAPLPPDAVTTNIQLPRQIEHVLYGSDVEDVNVTTNHLVRRGCFPSKEEEDDIGPTTCDGSVPPLDELRAQIQRWGQVAARRPAFYTFLGAGGAIKTSKCWVQTHPDLIAPVPNPKIDNLGAVFFDDIVDKRYEAVIGSALSAGRQVSYQKLLSQAMAMESQGEVWIFTKADVDFDTLPPDNTWKNWELPALTRNDKVDRIIRTDPTDGSDPPITRVIWQRGDPPTANEPRGLVES